MPTAAATSFRWRATRAGEADEGAVMSGVRSVRPVQIRVKVADVRRAAAFYTSAFDLVFNESISSLQFGTYRTDRFFLITLEEEASGFGGTRLGLLVDDVDAAHGRAIGAGGVEVHPPADFAWKPRTSCVRDPDGNVIDLSQA